MTQQPKLIRRAVKVVDTAPQSELSSKRIEANDRIKHIAARFKQDTGHTAKTFDMIVSVLDSFNERLSALEKV